MKVKSSFQVKVWNACSGLFQQVRPQNKSLLIHLYVYLVLSKVTPVPAYTGQTPQKHPGHVYSVQWWGKQHFLLFFFHVGHKIPLVTYVLILKLVIQNVWYEYYHTYTTGWPLNAIKQVNEAYLKQYCFSGVVSSLWIDLAPASITSLSCFLSILAVGKKNLNFFGTLPLHLLPAVK